MKFYFFGLCIQCLLLTFIPPTELDDGSSSGRVIVNAQRDCEKKEIPYTIASVTCEESTHNKAQNCRVTFNTHVMTKKKHMLEFVCKDGKHQPKESTFPTECLNRVPTIEFGQVSECEPTINFKGVECKVLTCEEKFVRHPTRSGKIKFKCKHNTIEQVSKVSCRLDKEKTKSLATPSLKHLSKLEGLVHHLFNASFYQMGMETFYGRSDVALPGFAEYMRKIWNRSMKQAHHILGYINKRGGTVDWLGVHRPNSYDFLMHHKLNSKPPKVGLKGLEMELDSARLINEQALHLHSLCKTNPHLAYFLESGLLSDQVESIKILGDYITRLESFSEDTYSIGEVLLDTELHD